MSKLTVELSGDTGITVRRQLNAPPDAVFEAHVNPAIIAQWMIGAPDWTMPVCVSDARPGGKIRYEWHHPTRPSFHLTGEYIEVQRPHRLRVQGEQSRQGAIDLIDFDQIDRITQAADARDIGIGQGQRCVVRESGPAG